MWAKNNNLHFFAYDVIISVISPFYTHWSTYRQDNNPLGQCTWSNANNVHERQYHHAYKNIIEISFLTVVMISTYEVEEYGEGWQWEGLCTVVSDAMYYCRRVNFPSWLVHAQKVCFHWIHRSATAHVATSCGMSPRPWVLTIQSFHCLT